MNPYNSNYNMPYGQYQFQSPQRPQENLNWIFVSDISKVEQVSVQSGCKAWVMVQNEPIFALRVADNMGLVTTDYYRFEKISPDQMNNNSDYVTKDEMNQAIENLLKEIRNESTISKQSSKLTERSQRNGTDKVDN